jgi:cell division protein ZipA
MSELRWILIGFGIVLLAAIYLWGRRSRTMGSEDAGVRARPEPSFAQPEAPSFAARAGEPRIDADSDEDSRLIVTGAVGSASIAASPPPVTSLRKERTVEPLPAGVKMDPVTASDTWRGRLEPTLGEAAETEELPVRPDTHAPTLSSSEAPQARRIERRKILALRLAAAPQRIDGARLLEALEAESLQHGKYQIFHRLHDDGAGILFSAASMVEPGTFEPEKMASMQFPGVTLFAQLPGPAPGMHALNELVACARKLQQALGGTLQDDRGVPLTVHRIERMRQEVREFERPSARVTS